MRKMKNSGIEWIGEIPESWQCKKIKYCFSLVAGATPKSGNSDFWDGDIIWITPADYTTEDVYIFEGHKRITGEGLNSCATTVVPEGSIIFSKRAPVGLVAINKVPLCTNQGCISCIPNDDVDSKFYYYVMRSFAEQFDLYASGTTFKEISAEAFENFVLPNMEYSKQKLIVKYLDEKCAEIDTIISAKEKTNELLKERRKSIIYEAVTKGLDPNAPMKDSGIEWIGQIPNNWSVGKLGYFIQVFNGDRSSNYPSGNDLQEEGIPFLTSSNLEKDELTLADCKYITQEKYDSMGGFKMQKNDIVYCLRGSVGKCSINLTENQGTVASSLMGIRCTNIHPKFLLYVLKSPVIDVQNALYMNGTCAANLSAENVIEYKIPVLDIESQTNIVKYLDAKCCEFDKLISTNEETIEKLKEYRQSIIYEAVTGKVEI